MLVLTAPFDWTTPDDNQSDVELITDINYLILSHTNVFF